MKKGTKYYIGQPADYPTEFVNALSALFAKHPNVKAAYLTQYYNPDDGLPSHLLIGISIDGKFETLSDEIGLAIKETFRKGEPVDIVKIDSNDISDYLTTETQPFYLNKSSGNK